MEEDQLEHESDHSPLGIIKFQYALIHAPLCLYEVRVPNVFKAQWVLRVPPSFTCKKPKFFPRSVYVFHNIPTTNEIFTIPRVDRFLYILMETDCVYCAVRTGSLNIIQSKFYLYQRMHLFLSYTKIT